MKENLELYDQNSKFAYDMLFSSFGCKPYDKEFNLKDFYSDDKYLYIIVEARDGETYKHTILTEEI